MSRIPIPIVVLLGLLVMAVTWWRGTRTLDFLKPPTQLQLELARTHATGHVQRPVELFAVEPVAESSPAKIPAPEPPPDPPTVHVIEPTSTDLDTELHTFIRYRSLPPSAFIKLASTLEADTRLALSLLAWERILDSTSADEPKREAALNAVKRLRASLPPWIPADATGTPLVISLIVPADRIELSRQAATEAAEVLKSASSGILSPEVAIAKPEEEQETPTLILKLKGTADQSAETAQIELPAPARRQEILDTILRGVLKLVSAQLATSTDLTPPSPPAPGEKPADSLGIRVTRLSWQHFADSLQSTE